MVVTGGHLSDWGKGYVSDGGGGGQGWDGRLKEGFETEDSRIWGNGSGYNVS